jgi:2'-5' RNA ligase
MSYYLEAWLRGFAKDHLRSISTSDTESYHPHITLVRPFYIAAIDEAKVQKLIADFCAGKKPVPFSLEGSGVFDNKFHHVPVTDAAELLQFNDGLEAVLDGAVRFAPKLNEEKILHATIATDKPIPPCARIDQYMLRLTGIQDKRIWFSYDFVTQKVLDREQSLDKPQWLRTVNTFTNQTGLMPTRQGYARIGEPQ